MAGMPRAEFRWLKSAIPAGNSEAIVTLAGADPHPRLRVAALGCGRVFERFHFPALSQSSDWELVAAMDARPDRRRWIAAQLPGLVVAESLAELSPVGPLDAVLISTPPDSHCALAGEALRRGFQVLVEKPMALHPAEATSLLALGREMGRRILVGFNRRFRPSYQALRSSMVGTPADAIRGVRFDLFTDPRGWGPVSGYLGDGDRGGGVLDDIASHQIDLVPWVLGLPVEQVYARYRRRDTSATVIEITLRFGGGLEASCRAGHLPASREQLVVQLPHHALVATTSELVWLRAAPRALAHGGLHLRELAIAVAARLAGRPSPTQLTFRSQLAAWALALRSGNGANGVAEGHEGARCVALIEACRHSLALGGAWVTVASGSTPR
jgi:predicted dehydrogenase